MAPNPYKELSEEELADRIYELRESLFNLRVRNTTKELEDTSKIRSGRRELARALTAWTALQQNKEAEAAGS